MNRSVVTKRIIQGVAVAFGVLGLTLISMGIYSGITGFREHNYLTSLVGIAMSLALGGFVVGIAWMNLRDFGPRSIRHVTELVIVAIFFCFSPWLLQLMEWLDRATANPNLIVILLILVLYLLARHLVHRVYRGLNRKLIQLTGVADGREVEGER
jgi:hypothetical protein